MKALRKISSQPNQLVLQELAVPTIQNHEILIEVIYAGICGTDQHILKNEYPTSPPITLGHEFVGKIVQTGPAVNAFEIGDYVVSLTATLSCNNCIYCLQKTPMLCEQKKSIGSQVDGAFAQYLAIDAERAFKLPKQVTLLEASLAEPLACVLRGLIERSTVRVTDKVIISGPGTIGLLAAIVAKHLGAEVYLVGLPSDIPKLQIAKDQFNISTYTIDKFPHYLPNLLPFDVAIECSGHPTSLNNCIHWVRKQGRLIQMGLFGKRVTVDLDLMLTKELIYSNSFATAFSSWELALQFLQNKQVDLSALITDILPLSDWEEAFSPSPTKLKTLFTIANTK